MENIFALDIGTRSIVGVVMQKSEDTLSVIGYKSIFHDQRAMKDGQIEDIGKVSKTVASVRQSLEHDLGMELNDVCIAAAGRSLKTQKVSFEKELDIRAPITDEMKNIIEMEGLQKAQEAFMQENGTDTLFYCVGYSVLNYYLDGSVISNIINHRANNVSLDIIAAFLPHIVVEGLYTCMDNNNMNVTNLTLEPIAAINLVVPKELRLFNLALVDIGAGTSDIAISKNGSIVGYEMVTVAGDEITECLMKAYLIDFSSAEKLKLSLSDNSDKIPVTDILGMSYELDKQEVLSAIKGTVKNLCSAICEKILDINEEAPSAVYLIGGGSKIPFAKEFFSSFLGIPENRIALGSTSTVRNIDLSVFQNFGPEYITPVGIAYSGFANNGYDFFSVMVNDTKVRLYNIRKLKVMDALLMSGYDSKKLIGFSGKSLTFTVNGEKRYYSGEYSTPAEITVNGELSTIETELSAGDIIKIKSAVDGKTPIVKISDICGEPSEKGNITFNGTNIDIGYKFYVNNTEVSTEYIIGNSDAVSIIKIETLGDLTNIFEIDDTAYDFYSEGNLLSLECSLKDGMTISSVPKVNTMTRDNTMTESVQLPSVITVTLNGSQLSLPPKDDGSPYIFADMLIQADIDPTQPKGNIVLSHNGQPASYVNHISDGDVIIIKWEQR